jgi:hypothetical protein
MTTKITVDAHAGWPVRVARIGRCGGTGGCETVPANEKRDFYVHDGMDLLIREAKAGDQVQTEGEYRVGIAFNPSASGAVDSIKLQAASLIDALGAIAADRDHPGARCAALAMTEIESAAMWAVKAITKPAK